MAWITQNNRRIGLAGLAIVLLGLAGAALAGPLSQTGLFAFGLGFQIVRWGAYVAIGGGVLCLVSVIAAIAAHKGDFVSNAPAAMAGLVIAAVVVYVPYAHSSGGFPPIHDVTTDTENPPLFVDILPLRADARNTADYQREWKFGQRVINVPEEQKRAFPDIVPAVIDLPPDQAFVKAAKTVRDLKWTMVSEDPASGRIEAYDRTAWFGFIDDVVIRVQPEGTGSKVDVRSVSRVGGGDRGMNGKRIRKYLRTLTGTGAHG